MESFLFCRAYTIGAFDKVFAEESAPEHFPRDRTFHLRHIRLDIVLDEEQRAALETHLNMTVAGDVRGSRQAIIEVLLD